MSPSVINRKREPEWSKRVVGEQYKWDSIEGSERTIAQGGRGIPSNPVIVSDVGNKGEEGVVYVKSSIFSPPYSDGAP